MKTGVLVHGFHLQAENWEKIVWGKPPNLLGRAPKGVMVALEENADIIVFGTGASVKDGKKEAEYTRDYLLEHFLELVEFWALEGIDLAEAKEKISQIAKLEIKSQNTFQEPRFAADIFRRANAERIIIVSSPTHISRCLRDALMVFDREDVIAQPSHTGWADASEVIIIEPPYRPDRQKSNLHSFVKKLMALSSDEQEEIIKKALG